MRGGRRTFAGSCLFRVAVATCLSAWLSATPANENLPPEIVGGGAHFSWVVFDQLRPEIEAATGHKLKLYGKESMLGAGCNAGIKTARASTPNKPAFGLVCCPLSDQEVEAKGLVVHPLAWEPVLIIVNRENPISDLSVQQVRDIFSGKISNWQQVGGLDQAIVVVTRLHCKKRPGHWKTILPDADQFSDKRLNVQSAAEMTTRINDFAAAIGHVGSGWDFPEGHKIKIITVAGVQPNGENLANKSYPFFRQLAAVTNREPSAATLEVIQEAQRALANSPIAHRYRLLPFAQPQ